jgi:hypothetical protein
MERASYLSILGITILLLTSVTASVVAAEQGKSTHNERGGLSTHSGGSSKGTTNKNAQWSADPDQGWVRSHQNHSMQDRNKSTTSPKLTGGKNLTNGKQTKRP